MARDSFALEALGSFGFMQARCPHCNEVNEFTRPPGTVSIVNSVENRLVQRLLAIQRRALIHQGRDKEEPSNVGLRPLSGQKAPINPTGAVAVTPRSVLKALL